MARPSPALPPVAALLAALLAACNRAPAEPDAPPASSVTTPAAAPLAWDAPGAWTRLEAPPSGPQKASYRINKTGNDKDDAEMNVFFFGTGAKGDPAPVFKGWLGQFDGAPEAKRATLDVKGFKVETVEVTGTYKIALTPPTRGHNHPPVQMVKEHYRLYGAVVRTPDRGNWFFKLTGPDDTVQSATSALRGLFETLR
jgi:hypothetical protein